jgi:DNA modification methylase
LIEDWSFADLKRVETLWGPHGYHRYPAKFIPQLVHRVIERYSAPGELVGDPFLGSATTGIEALRLGRRFYGSDISQVALLISRAKCMPICPRELNETWRRLDHHLEAVQRIGRRQLMAEELEVISAIDIARATQEERFFYWFPTAYRSSLEDVLQEIISHSEGPAQTFFLCGFSNILKRCSIWLSGSTKAQKDMSKALADPVEEFRKQIRDMIKRNGLYWDDLAQHGLDPEALIDRCHISLADVRQLTLRDSAIDLLVTSPPYATCYEYKELHQLTQLWFERFGILASNNEQDGWIGSKSTSKRTIPPNPSKQHTGSLTADAALEKLTTLAEGAIAQRVKREVQTLCNYFQDMGCALNELARITAPGKRFVLIIGDSYRRGVTIPTSKALCEMALNNGFELERRIVRKIPARVLVSTRNRKTGRFSPSAQSDMQVYPEEHVLVFKRLG